MAIKKKKKKGSTVKRVFITLLVLIVLLTSGFFLIYNQLLGDINSVDITDSAEELNISSELLQNKKIINIALFGIDTRDKDYDSARADTIMIASVDKVHKKLKLTSVMRDTYISIPGKKYDKINHSYAFGGPELTIKTLNQNFDMNIKDYVTVNFTALEKIVDAVDGVEIEIKSSEIESLNHNLQELDYVNNTNSQKILSGGTQILNGSQAVAYSRIRKVGNGDYERTQRQRTVLQKVVTKVLNKKSLPHVLTLIETLSPYIETSLSKGEMIGLATSIFTSGIDGMEDARLPLDNHVKGGMWNGTYYLKPNKLVDNVAFLHNFIYEEENYIPSSTVKQINDEI